MKHPCYFPDYMHLHTFFEIIYVIEGFSSNIIDNKKLVMHPGDICIIPPEVTHFISCNSESVIMNILIRTSAFSETFNYLLNHSSILSEFFSEILYSNRYKKYLLFHAPLDNDLISFLLNMYVEQNQNMKYHTMIMNAYLSLFLGTLLREYENTVKYPKSYYNKFDPVPNILNFIRKDLKNSNLEKCADHFHFNPQYLSNLLKKHAGKSFLQFVTDCKIEEVSKLILKGDMTIDKIAEYLGYENASYFMKVFKKHTGYTPTEYRKAKS